MMFYGRLVIDELLSVTGFLKACALFMLITEFLVSIGDFTELAKLDLGFNAFYRTYLGCIKDCIFLLKAFPNICIIALVVVRALSVSVSFLTISSYCLCFFSLLPSFLCLRVWSDILECKE